MGEGGPQAETRVHLETILPAPPERVFAAFVDPQQLSSWFGPKGFRAQGLHDDAVEGGGLQIAVQPPEGDVFHIRGTFRTLEAPRRLAFTFVYEQPDPDDQETLVTVTFEPVEQGTRVVLDQGPFKTAARCALHRDGWTDSFDRLEQSLA